MQPPYRETTNMMCSASFINCLQAIQWLFCQVWSGTQTSRLAHQNELVSLPVLIPVCKDSSHVSMKLDIGLLIHILLTLQ